MKNKIYSHVGDNNSFQFIGVLPKRQERKQRTTCHQRTRKFRSWGNSHSKFGNLSAYFSEDAYKKAAEPKELFVVPNASHVDLYDRPEYMSISLPKLDTFFKQYLK